MSAVSAKKIEDFDRQMENPQNRSTAVPSSYTSRRDTGNDPDIRESKPPYAGETSFAEAFEKNARAALSRLVWQIVGSDPSAIRGEERLRAVRLIFQQIIDATPYAQRMGTLALLNFAEPAEILSVAISEHDVYGYEGRLLMAANLLDLFGTRSWPVLRELAKSGRPECEFFVSTIASFRGVPEEERLSALADLACNPHRGTRRRVLELLEDFPPDKTTAIVGLLLAWTMAHQRGSK